MSRARYDRKVPPALRVVLVVLISVLVITPALDLGWNEPTLDENQGAGCQLHANPATGPQPVAPAIAFVGETLVLVEPPDPLPLIGSSIFVPPRG